jgi:phosphohistidine phosphatase
MGTLRLTLLRHGQAEPLVEGADDFVRELTKRGRAEATVMGQRLGNLHLLPQLILASSARRTQMTVQLLAAAASIPPGTIQYLDELYNASAHHIWGVAIAKAGSHAHVLVCGHNPGISRLASQLGSARAGAAQAARVDLPPAGLVTGVWHGSDWTMVHVDRASAVEYLLPLRPDRQ